MRTGKPKRVALVLLIMGIVFTAVPFVFQSKIDADTKGCNETTYGTVIDFKIKTDDDGPMYAAIYEYMVDGETYTVNSRTYTSSIPRIGSTSDIAYDETNPSYAYVEKDTEFIKLVLIPFRVIGIIFLVLFGITIIKALLGLVAMGVLIKGQNNNTNTQYNNGFGNNNFGNSQPGGSQFGGGQFGGSQFGGGQFSGGQFGGGQFGSNQFGGSQGFTTGTTRCINCGQEINAGMINCPYCGAKQQ